MPYASTKTMTQKVCIGLGFVFVVTGLAGILMPGLMGMHLSLSHNFIHLVSGALALWSGYSDNSRKAYNFCIGFGTFYGILGVAGFAFGEPGYPGVGHMEADDNLMRIIPNVLEFGTADHSIHILFSAIFLITAFAFRRNRAEAGVITENGQTVTNFTIRDSHPDGKLPLDEGIRHIPHQDRHSDFERRV